MDVEVVGSYMDPSSECKKAFLPPVSLYRDEQWDKSSPNFIKFNFGKAGEGCSWGEVVLVASRESEEDSLVVRSTMSLNMRTPEVGLTRRNTLKPRCWKNRQGGRTPQLN